MSKKKEGFTLLEIIVVIIILGVLAGLALPRLFSNIEFSRSAEALNAIGVIRGSVERCALMRGGYGQCSPLPTNPFIDVQDPSLEAGSHFDYNIQMNNISEGNYQILATRNAVDNGDGTSQIIFTIWHNDVSGGGLIQRAGTGVFSSIQ